jgi:large subunit ribosomal protein L25
MGNMSEATIQVQERTDTGKGVNRKLRDQGWIPAVVYGGGKDPVAIQVDRRAFLDLLREAGSENAVFLLELAGTGKKRHTMVRQIDADPITRRVLHVDFQRVLMDEKVRITVPVEVVGVAEGVKTHGGVLDFVTREVAIECLPGDIPTNLEIDVTPLEIGDHLEVSDLVLPKGVELLEEPDRTVVSVAAPRVEEVEEEEEDVLIEAEVDEPEVIGRGKDDEEEEDRAGA